MLSCKHRVVNFRRYFTVNYCICYQLSDLQFLSEKFIISYKKKLSCCVVYFLTFRGTKSCNKKELLLFIFPILVHEYPYIWTILKTVCFENIKLIPQYLN